MGNMVTKADRDVMDRDTMDHLFDFVEATTKSNRALHPPKRFVHIDVDGTIRNSPKGLMIGFLPHGVSVSKAGYYRTLKYMQYLSHERQGALVNEQ